MHLPPPPCQLVLNWHLTEACNYQCCYCFAAWHRAKDKRDVVRDPQRTQALLGELYRFFQSDHQSNPLWEHLKWTSVRLNIAGGEPLLHSRRVLSVVREARALGLEVSLITNGSLLTKDLLSRLAPDLVWLGISIDSANPAINHAIGRISSHEQVLNLEVLSRILSDVRSQHPQFRLKINTVVNRMNFDDDLRPHIRRVAPDKWKVLRMLPVADGSLAISDEQFSHFLDRHAALKGIWQIEDNPDMRASYLMVDPNGRFYQNSPSSLEGYLYSDPILDVGAEKAFAQISLSPDTYRSRYRTPVVRARR